MVKRYKRRYVVLEVSANDTSKNLKAEIMSVLNEVVSKEKQEEVHPLILKSGENIVIVRVPHVSLEQFKKNARQKLPFLKIVFVSGTLKSIRERMGLTKDDMKTIWKG